MSQLVLAVMFVILAIGGSTRCSAQIASSRGWIPIGSWWWIRGDRTRIGAAVVVVVGLVMPVLVVRIQPVWAGPGALTA